MNDVTVTICGNTTAPPDLVFGPSGTARCSFTLAVNSREKQPDGSWGDGPATCSADGCDRAAVKRGMCGTDYQRWRAATPPEQRRRPTAEERFWAKVQRGFDDECWPWTDVPSDNGYGSFYVGGGRKVGAHRYAFWLANGYAPDQVDHACHNGSGCTGGSSCPHRRCCNPAHLDDTSNLTNSLRGESFAAKHARQTHCVNGHEFTAENTYVYQYRDFRPRRMCKQCDRDRQSVKAEKRRSGVA